MNRWSEEDREGENRDKKVIINVLIILSNDIAYKKDNAAI